MIKVYTAKPFEVQAIEWNGNNFEKVREFTLGRFFYYESEISHRDGYKLETLRGDIKVFIGDFIIKDVSGEFSICKPETFIEKYELN